MKTEETVLDKLVEKALASPSPTIIISDQIVIPIGQLRPLIEICSREENAAASTARILSTKLSTRSEARCLRALFAIDYLLLRSSEFRLCFSRRLQILVSFFVEKKNVGPAAVHSTPLVRTKLLILIELWDLKFCKRYPQFHVLKRYLDEVVKAPMPCVLTKADMFQKDLMLAQMTWKRKVLLRCKKISAEYLPVVSDARSTMESVRQLFDVLYPSMEASSGMIEQDIYDDVAWEEELTCADDFDLDLEVPPDFCIDSGMNNTEEGSDSRKRKLDEFVATKDINNPMDSHVAVLGSVPHTMEISLPSTLDGVIAAGNEEVVSQLLERIKVLEEGHLKRLRWSLVILSKGKSILEEQQRFRESRGHHSTVVGINESGRIDEQGCISRDGANFDDINVTVSTVEGVLVAVKKVYLDTKLFLSFQCAEFRRCVSETKQLSGK